VIRAAWVVGGSGLLGSALRRRLGATFAPRRVPWGTDAAAGTLAADLDRFLAGVRPDQAWTVYWAAGAGTIGTSAAALARETTAVAAFAAALAARADYGRGAFFLASSASVYARSTGPPFDEESAPAPGSDYARARLEQERVVAAALDGRLRHVLGRMSTLYGTGQNLNKGQGLISVMCLQTVQRRPIRLFVPLDTLRDYLYADDAAAIIEALVAAAHASPDLGTRLRVIAHGAAVSLANLTAQVNAVGRRGVRMQRVIVPLDQHARDLRLRTRYAAESAHVPRTPLPVGIATVQADLFGRLARGEFACAAPERHLAYPT
jgi:UDP-glucose 4-epimerase